MSSSSSTDGEESAVPNAKRLILNTLLELDQEQRGEIENWFAGAQYQSELSLLVQWKKERDRIEEIATAIREQLGPDAVLPSEKIEFPNVGDLSDCSARDTLHVDEFLCDDERLERLAEGGELSRHYCTECGSRHVKELTLISHSLGINYQLYMFKFLLPDDLSGRTILDIGSRLGAVLYGAYYFTNASRIVGVEMNKELCDVQERTIDKFKLSRERIRVVNADVVRCAELVASADVIVWNVVDLFVDTVKQREMWDVVRAHARVGATLVSMRGVTHTWTSLGLLERLGSWLRPATPQQPHNETLVYDDNDQYCDMCSYVVQE